MALADTLFRLAIGGHVAWYRLTGGRLAGSRVLLLTTTGRRTGLERTSPLMYLEEGDAYVVAASMGGAPRHPGWFHNLQANPSVTVQVGALATQRRARVIEGAERDELWQRFVTTQPRFEQYQEKTDRTIPVVALEPV